MSSKKLQRLKRSITRTGKKILQTMSKVKRSKLVQESMYHVMRLVIADADNYNQVRVNDKFIYCLLNLSPDGRLPRHPQRERQASPSRCKSQLPDFEAYDSFVDHLIFLYDTMGRVTFLSLKPWDVQLLYDLKTGISELNLDDVLDTERKLIGWEKRHIDLIYEFGWSHTCWTMGTPSRQ